VDYIPASTSLAAGAIPATDFFGNPRPDSGTCIDVGASSFSNSNCGVLPYADADCDRSASRTRPPIGSTIYAETLTGTNLTGATAVNVSGTGMTCVITGTPTATTVTANCTSRLPPTRGRNVSVTTPGGNQQQCDVHGGDRAGADFDRSHVGTQGTAPR